MYYNEFRKLGIDAPNRTGGQVKTTCPRCTERKGGRNKDKDLSINFDTGAYKCHSAKCDFQGYALKKEYARPQWHNRTNLPAHVVKYFESRGISQKTLKEFRISVDEKGNLQFNYWRADMLVNVKTRYERDGKKTYSQHSGAEKIVYNYNSLIGRKKCIIVEGEMDVLTWHQVGLSDCAIISVDQGAPAPGQRSDGKLECFAACADQLDAIEEFYLCTDKDAPGVYLQEEIINRVGAHRCFIVDLPEGVKDANQVIDQRESPYEVEVGLETLRRQLEGARPVPIPGIHELDKEVQERMEEYFREGRPLGKSLLYREFSNYFSVMKGEITLFSGLPGDGKSQFIRQLAVILAKSYGWKFAFYAPEDFPVDMFYDDIIHIYMAKSPYKGHENQMSPEEYQQGIGFVRSHFFCIYPVPDKEGKIPLPTNEWINKRISFLKLKHGVNCYVKDPWNKIYHDIGHREDQYLALELSKEKFFAAQYDLAWYVAHPHKMHKDNDGKYPKPGPYDLSGGAMWYNQIDNMVVVYRPNKHQDKTDKMVEVETVKIKKQKLVGKLGQCDFWYDFRKNRYYEHGDDHNPLEDVTQVPEWYEEEVPF